MNKVTDMMMIKVEGATVENADTENVDLVENLVFTTSTVEVQWENPSLAPATADENDMKDTIFTQVVSKTVSESLSVNETTCTVDRQNDVNSLDKSTEKTYATNKLCEEKSCQRRSNRKRKIKSSEEHVINNGACKRRRPYDKSWIKPCESVEQKEKYEEKVALDCIEASQSICCAKTNHNMEPVSINNGTDTDAIVQNIEENDVTSRRLQQDGDFSDIRISEPPLEEVINREEEQPNSESDIQFKDEVISDDCIEPTDDLRKEVDDFILAVKPWGKLSSSFICCLCGFCMPLLKTIREHVSRKHAIFANLRKNRLNILKGANLSRFIPQIQHNRANLENDTCKNKKLKSNHSITETNNGQNYACKLSSDVRIQFTAENTTERNFTFDTEIDCIEEVVLAGPDDKEQSRLNTKCQDDKNVLSTETKHNGRSFDFLNLNRSVDNKVESDYDQITKDGETFQKVSDVKNLTLSNSVLHAFIEHMYTIVCSETKIFECKFCCFQSVIIDNDNDNATEDLLQHQHVFHGRRPESNACLECMIYFSSRLYLQHHNTKEHDGEVHEYRCEACSVSFHFAGRYESHMIQNHSVTHSLKCPEKNCCFIASDELGLKIHAKSHSRSLNKQLIGSVCELCGMSLAPKENLLNHQARKCPATVAIVEDDRSLLECHACSKVFPSVLVRKKHERLFHSGPHQCPFDNCNKTYREVKTLNTHINKEHYKRWRVICDLCGLNVADQSSLKLHYKTVHMKIKDVACTWPNCGMKFGRKSAMEIHYRRHTGEKRFTCEYCSFRGNQRGSLNYHMKSKHPGKIYHR